MKENCQMMRLKENVQRRLDVQLKSYKIFFLITDLNLTFEESKQLDQDIENLNLQGFDIELLLLDHHGSGKKSADCFDWYFLDTSRSATKITFDYFYNTA